MDALKDFIALLFEPAVCPAPVPTEITVPQDVANRYRTVMADFNLGDYEDSS